MTGEFVTRLVEVYLLIAEREGFPALTERYLSHAQYLGVERAGSLDVPHGENQVVQPVYDHRVARGCEASTLGSDEVCGAP